MPVPARSGGPGLLTCRPARRRTAGTGGRNALAQRHLDLENEFSTRVRQRGAVTDVETRLHGTIVKVKETIKNKNEELPLLCTDVPNLVRGVHALALENQ